MMDTMEVEKSACLKCHTECDRVSGDGQPRAGDITVCINCGHVMAFTDSLGFRELNRRERRFAARNKEIAVAKALIR
jgi:hypothetical protein